MKNRRNKLTGILLVGLYISGILLVGLLSSCSKQIESDAFGNFEAIETIISSEATGTLISFNIEEGQIYQMNEEVGIIDTLNLHLQKNQLLASKASVSSKIANILSQIAVYKEQKTTLLKDQERLQALLKDGAATQKQVDDINGAINVTDKQIASIETQNSGVLNEIKSLEWKSKIIDDQISKCKITNPIKGTVLEKYVEQNEFVNRGKPLYKIANLEVLELRVYVSGTQLSQIKIGQKVTVLTDKSKTENFENEGIISWISNQAEFTPKIIQTKEERVKLVYAVKVKVKNDGRLKIGMPGEILIQK